MEILSNKKLGSTCNICSKELSSKQNLKHHMNIHTGERPFHCNFPGCLANYKHASQLSNHKIIHKPQPTMKISHDFTDLRSFLAMVINYFECDAKLRIIIPAGPFTVEDCTLNPIINRKSWSILPKFNPSL